MKLPALLLAGSLAANVVVVGVLAWKPALAPAAVRGLFAPGASVTTDDGRAADPAKRRAVATARSRAGSEAARRAQLWAALNSDDLRTLVANLRAAGFTPAVIRALVSAKIELRLRDRMKELVGTVKDTPFWKPEAMGPFNNVAFFESYNQVFRDRARMMREILGDDSFASNPGDVTAAQQRQFGNLSKAKIDLIQRINDDYAEMTSQVRASTRGMLLAEDREKLALLEREKHTDLAAILTPQELEDYEMRSSQVTMRLNTTLSIMDASEAEFRAIYQIHNALADRLYPTAGVLSRDAMQSRRDAQTQAADQLKAALGEERAAEFARANNYEYQQLYRLAQRENLPPEAAVRTFELRDTTAQESMRIFNDPALSTDQKRTALQSLAQNAKAQVIATLGTNAGSVYTKSASWITYMERGGGVIVNPDGGTNFRSLPPAGFTPPPRG